MADPSMSRFRTLLVAFFVAVAVGGGAWFLVNGPGIATATPQSATIFPEPRALPEFRLVDHRGQPFGRDELEGHTSLLFFGFTHCPDICPATLQQLAVARRQLRGEGEALPEIVLISVDPARDTPEVMERYVEYFGQGVTGVTGRLEELRALAAPLGIHFENTPAANGSADDYTVSHSAAVLVIDPQARLAAIFGAPHSVEAFVNDLPLLMASQ
jgi:protein SCO1/2